MAQEIKDIFIHHVYFWLVEKDNKEHKKLLIDGLKKLSGVSTIQRFHIGEPANTSRGVIDTTYSVSWILIFNNPADQDSYQVDPIHLKFVEECKHLWNKVVVYDSIDV
jgi:Stress responsive A/B Barrel Domain